MKYKYDTDKDDDLNKFIDELPKNLRAKVSLFVYELIY